LKWSLPLRRVLLQWWWQVRPLPKWLELRWCLQRWWRLKWSLPLWRVLRLWWWHRLMLRLKW
jgi:hypothetical protein